MECGCLIVGGGLAGCTAGVLLRRAGVDVLMLELLDAKAKDKLCGGLMFSESMDDYIRIFGKAAARRIDAETPDRIRKRYAGREIVWLLDLAALQRKQLDDGAMESYLSAGGRLMDRTTVRRLRAEDGAAECEDLRTGETFTVRFSHIVGADGAMSAVRRLATGKKPRVCFAMETTVERRGGDVILEFLSSPMTGYVWYIPQGPTAVIGLYLRREPCA